MSNEIKVGDKVEVIFSTSRLAGEVLYIPCATGDSWHIENDDGIHYVQQFERMTKYNGAFNPLHTSEPLGESGAASC